MTGDEQPTIGVVSDHSASCTTASVSALHSVQLLQDGSGAVAAAVVTF